MLTPTSELVSAAAGAGAGIPAFNGITLEHGEAIIRAAEAARTPVILALSHNAVRFHGALEPVAAAYRELAESCAMPIGLHLDHVEDLALVEAATRLGFGSVMFDAAHLPYADNVELTARAARLVHSRGRWLESELGEVGGKDGFHAPHARTDPGEAAAYVAATGVDALAVAVGNSHAMTEATATLDFELIRRLRHAVEVPLVLHGSSGVPDAAIAAGVLCGLVKINVGTQLNVAYTRAVAAALRTAETPDPRRYLRQARDEMVRVVVRLINVVTQPSTVLAASPAVGQ